MASKKKTPPKFSEGTSYVAWRNKIEMWKRVTSVVKEEQVIVVLLDSLEGNSKAEKATANFTDTDLFCADGLQKLIEKLDSVFKSEKVDEAYEAYSKFTKFERISVMTIEDYILDFELLYDKMGNNDMRLPEAMKAFRLLDGANLEDSDRKFALTIASDMKFDTMKAALKRIFSKPGSSSHTPSPSSSPSDVKQEEAFYSKNKY